MGATVPDHLPNDLTRSTLHTRVPVQLAAAVDRFAAKCGMSRSEAVRALLGRALESRGLWPPALHNGKGTGHE
jgi:hypothetical protein